MRLYSITGKLINRSMNKYYIDWDKPSRSQFQFKIKQFLKQYWRTHVVTEEFPVYGTRLKVDFINFTKRIAIEVNGSQHSKFNSFFHNNSRLDYLKSIKRDVKKAEWLEMNSIKLIEL